MKAINVRVEGMKNPVGISEAQPLLAWCAEGGARQSAYRVIAAAEHRVLYDSGKVAGSVMQTRIPQTMSSRRRVTVSISLWDENDVCEEAENVAFYEYALFEKSDYAAKWIAPEIDPISPDERQKASYLKKTFTVKVLSGNNTARLYATAHGVYTISLNGSRVEGAVLSPGTTEYGSRMALQTYDVTPYLREGENTIEVALGDGWYRGCNGNTGTRNVFGTELALWLQLELDGQPVCISDEGWLASQDGAVGLNDMQLGEQVDARRKPSYSHGVRIKNFGTDNFFCTNTHPLMEKEVFTAKLINTPNGKKVLDFGQNMAGYIAFSVQAESGQKIRLTLGEYLDEDGNFSDANLQTIGRQGEKLHQVIDYICIDGLNEYKTQFAIFGFQMAEIETDIAIDGSEFRAIAVYSDVDVTADFNCGLPLVNRLFRNAVWSEKSNFVDIPIDCPQRERSGWTGDAGLFAETGITLMNVAGVYEKWLGECRALQYEDGRVANIAPRRQQAPTKLDGMYDGASAWGDAVVIIPYMIYRLYGDKRVLSDNYDMMKKWVGYCEKKAKKTRLKNHLSRNPYKQYMIDTGIQWGEWLEAGISVNDAMKDIILKGIPEMTTPYLVQSARMLSEMAEILGKEEDAAHYKDLYEKANKAYHYIELRDGHIHSDRQCRYVRPLYMGLLTDDEAKAAAADLNELVIRNGYHLNTGFLTTPYLCQVLADNGYVETAYRVLMQEDTPGWLFAIKNGATTVWESWEGYFGDVGFASLNHYSKGAVTGWMIRGILGIRYTHSSVEIRPQPCQLMGSASGYFDSPRGRIESAWEYDADGNISYTVSIPSNVEASFIFPDGKVRRLATGKNMIRT